MATAKGPKRKPRINKNPNVVPQENNGGSLSPEVIAAFQSRNDEAESEVRGRLGELMSYLQGVGGRAQDNIGRAGAYLGDLDAKYANALDSRIMQSNPESSLNAGISAAVATPLNQAVTIAEGNRLETLLSHGAVNALRGTNIAARYGIPAAGLTAAGVGLMDLTHEYQNQFGGPADEQEATSLPLY